MRNLLLLFLQPRLKKTRFVYGGLAETEHTSGFIENAVARGCNGKGGGLGTTKFSQRDPGTEPQRGNRKALRSCR